MTARRGWSLSARFAAVTLVALIAATLVNFAVTFSGPPPMRRPVMLFELLPALAGQAQPPRDYPWVSAPVSVAAFTPANGERLQPAVGAALARSFGVPVGQVAVSERRGRPGGGGEPRTLQAFDGFTLGLRQADGSWRVMRGEPAPFITGWHRLTLGLTLAAALLFALLAMLVARSVVRPLDRLGQEADRSGPGSGGAITLEGPPEVVRVARAVAEMRDRLAGALEQRTLMFTALAHDMAAPLARLRFRLNELPEAQRDAAERDVAELSDMIAGIVEYAAIGRAAAPHQPLDAIALARDLAEREEMPFASDVDSAVVSGDAAALRRVLTNLATNARRYAGGGELVAELERSRLTLSVRDRGAGVPAGLAERLFEPFFRVEPSRNRETAGAGLGLAIARAIAEAHGGTLACHAREGGGAEFRLTLPLASAA